MVAFKKKLCCRNSGMNKKFATEDLLITTKALRTLRFTKILVVWRILL
jgi:hypothetical protein